MGSAGTVSGPGDSTLMCGSTGGSGAGVNGRVYLSSSLSLSSMILGKGFEGARDMPALAAARMAHCSGVIVGMGRTGVVISSVWMMPSSSEDGPGRAP